MTTHMQKMRQLKLRSIGSTFMNALRQWAGHQRFYTKATLPEMIYSFRGWQRANGIDPDAEVSRANVAMLRFEAEELFAKYG